MKQNQLIELIESLNEYDDLYIDPLEPYKDSGNFWCHVGSEHLTQGQFCGFDEQSLSRVRETSRILALSNEFAINAFENRINFIVGKGHRYNVIGRSKALTERVEDVINDFIDENDWNDRQQEIVKRRDRDGECFIRIFNDNRGNTQIRFVEPDQIYTPKTKANDKSHYFGIHTHKDDVETIYGYWVDNQYIRADEIQHRKANVDRNVRRGIPLMYPVQKNLRRAEKLLRNMSVVAEIQSSIALIRKHSSGNTESIKRYVNNQTQQTAGYQNKQKFEPGTIIDAQSGTDYEFPITAIDASRYILVLQAELRAIASRLVMPEFMLSSDASNANYSSTMIAEGPAVRMFERMQHEMIQQDRRLFKVVVQNAINANKLPIDTLKRVTIHAVAPIIAVRDRLKEAQADEILLKYGVLSSQTMAMRYGLDPTSESNLKCQCSTNQQTGE